MKIVFFGTADFAVPALRAVAEYVVLVVTQPDRPSGRGMQLRACPVKAAAHELSLPVASPEKARDPEFVEHIRNLDADFLLVAAYGQILSVKLLESAKHGGINLHGSILPRYRGAAPIQRCIEAGDTKTGVTLMQMAKGMDTGDIIDVQTLRIGPDETSGELFGRLAELAGNMAKTWAPRLATGDYPRLEQDHVLATHAAKIEKAEAELLVANPAELEYRKFRAFTPSPGAWIQTPHGLLRITRAKFNPGLNARPGTLHIIDGVATLAFASGGIELHEVQLEGKKRTTGAELMNGLRLSQGHTLVSPVG